MNPTDAEVAIGLIVLYSVLAAMVISAGIAALFKQW
jgi:hypothetical protein